MTPDIYLLQEPYLAKGTTFGLRLGWRVVLARSGKALLAVRNPGIKMFVRHVGDHVVAADLLVGNDHITAISFYVPPSQPHLRLVRELEAVIHSISSPNILLAGDANVHSNLWGPEVLDRRRLDEGGPFIDMILQHGLYIWNNPHSIPTFETDRGSSWIDVTLSTSSLYHRKVEWTLHRTILSDHNPIVFQVKGLGQSPASPCPPRLSQRQVTKVAKATQMYFHQIEHELAEISSRNQLAEWVTKFTTFIQTAGVSTVPSLLDKLKVPWWDSTLEIQRKKTRALRARFLRCRQPRERLLRRMIYKKEQAYYKYLIKSKSRACFNELCLQLTKQNPFQLPYKLAAQKLRSPTLLQRVKDSNF
ncbi:hypothetical protein AVEN_84918-1 [Araneus ventricosus]|uniref:Endonuclease/exonuclease/phosphatase domain-containing protein n=1 Tax=Araneus ventricosus TaxID=182803 RepID=A0A4Y2C0C4_ARAVE|nr:hypothetical protein AVEN_84918-1 [Araneus ventricosus]